MVSLLAPDAHDPQAPVAVLESAAGPSGIRLLGRFGHGDPALLERMRAHARAEEALRPDMAYFEIAHLPEGRTGNVLARPLLRELELEYLGASGAPADRRLSIIDLTLRLDSGRVALRSRSLGREVRPRLSSAHYTGWRSLGIYRFLAALQAEGAVEGVGWNWGPLEFQPRLPRVRMGRLVLARQVWNVSVAEARRLRAPRGHAAFAEVQRWRAERGLPRLVGLANADNVLPIDLDHPISVAAFLDELVADAPFALQELVPGAPPDAVETPEGRLTNEIVIPVTRRVAPVPPPRVRSTHSDADRTVHAGTFQPGSEWLTVKLYAGPATVDRVLVEAVAPTLAALRAEGALHRAFFVRYADPHWHVRVRLHGVPQALLACAAPALHAAVSPLLGEGAVHRIVLDPYTRETTRYGGAGAVEECEALFAHDSDATLAFLALAGGDRGLDARWRFALIGIDRLMDDFGLDLSTRRALVAEQAQGFAREMSVDRAMRKAMMARYRDQRRAIEALLAGESEDETMLAGARLLQERTRAGRPHVEALRRLEREESSHGSDRGAGDEPGAHARQPRAALVPARAGVGDPPLPGERLPLASGTRRQRGPRVSDDPLFRAEAIEEYLRGRDHGRLLRVSPWWKHWAFGALLVMFAGAVLFASRVQLGTDLRAPAVVRTVPGTARDLEVVCILPDHNLPQLRAGQKVVIDFAGPTRTRLALVLEPPPGQILGPERARTWLGAEVADIPAIDGAVTFAVARISESARASVTGLVAGRTGTAFIRIGEQSLLHALTLEDASR